MPNHPDIHAQFAEFFDQNELKPYAYLLSKKMAEGHVCIAVDSVMKESAHLPYDKIASPDVLEKLTTHISTDPAIKRPFILFGGHLYLHRYFNYETSLLDSLDGLMNTEKALLEFRKQALENLRPMIIEMADKEKSEPTDVEEWKTDWQLVAAIAAFLNNFTIITGGPGTGKTTTVAKILNLLLTDQPRLRIALAAPTGKAAMRMSESLKATMLNISDEVRLILEKLEPSTIHRLLGPKKDSIYFKHNRHNLLPHDVIIVDESSMLDVALFAKLLESVGPKSRLILLGDKNQLASVEAGSLFGDLCRREEAVNRFDAAILALINSFFQNEEKKIPASALAAQQQKLNRHVIELKKSHRFNAKSAIGNFSRALIHNKPDEIRFFIEKNTDPSVQIHTHKSAAVFDAFALAYAEYIQEKDIKEALKKLNRLRVLCAVREGDNGIYTINRRIEKLLSDHSIKNYDGSSFNPQGDQYVNRPVMVTQNNNDLRIYNGDIGIMRFDYQKRMHVWFEDKGGEIRSIYPSYISAMETVFAMTIHKSQGSEYPSVLILLPDNKENKLLTRELVYTAVTRASSKVVVMSHEVVLMQAAEAKVERVSGLPLRMV